LRLLKKDWGFLVIGFRTDYFFLAFWANLFLFNFRADWNFLKFCLIDYFFKKFLAHCKMFGSDSNSAFPPLPPRSKNVARNRTNVGWKHGTDA